MFKIKPYLYKEIKNTNGTIFNSFNFDKSYIQILFEMNGIFNFKITTSNCNNIWYIYENKKVEIKERDITIIVKKNSSLKIFCREKNRKSGIKIIISSAKILSGTANYIKNSENVLYFILVCDKNIDKWDKIKKKMEENKIENYLFIKGDSEITYIDDENKTLYLNVKEKYENLPNKVIEGIDWIVKNTNCKYIYKIDDDHNINKYPLIDNYYYYDYYGNFTVDEKTYFPTWHNNKCDNNELNIKENEKFKNNYAAGGYGYLLSRKSMEIISNNKNYNNNEIYEDKLMGEILYNNEIYVNKINKPNIIKEQEIIGNDKVSLYTKIFGGFGNQLFMIFNIISLSKEYNKKFQLYFDENYIDTYFKNRNTLLKDSTQYDMLKNFKFDKINDDELQKFEIYYEPEFKYNKINLQNCVKYNVNGYFQSYKYFWDNIDEIKKYLHINYDKLKEIDNKFKTYKKEIIAIHIRLRDYVNLQDYHPIPSLEYYKKALSYYDLNKYQIILFSDDINDAKEKLKYLNLNYIDANELYSNDEDQFYMLCLSNIRICSNSTFSLMSCYLNEMYNFKENCEYIFPQKWFGYKGPKYDIYNLIPISNYKYKILNECDNNLKVSILIPTHDLKGIQIEFMKKTLPMIFNQTYKNFEIIITDNNDESSTKDFIFNNFYNYYLTTNPSKYNIENFDINKIKHTFCKTKGWSPNHNHGLDHCSGDVIKILHQDNYFLNQFSLENIMYEFINDSDVKWSVSTYWHEYENNLNKLTRLHIPKYIDEIVNGENLIGDPSCMTLRKEYVLKFNNSMTWLVDCEYYIQMKHNFGTPKILKTPSVVVFQHKNQVTHTINIETQLKEQILCDNLKYKYNMKVSKYPCFIDKANHSLLNIYDKKRYTLSIYTHYINLEHRKDRNDELVNELKKANITKYERFNAIKPDKAMIENCKLININELWKKDGIPPNINIEKDFNYIRGAVGCKMSHFEILNNFYKYPQSKYILILEDDCVLKNNCIQNIENSIKNIESNNLKFNILYLSVTIHHREYYNYCEKINEHLLKIKTGWGNTTHAMIFSIQTVKNVIDILNNSNNEIDDVYKNKVNNRYVTNPMIGHQRESVSDIGLFREDEMHIKDGGIVSYGKLDEKYIFKDVNDKEIKYMLYKPDKLNNNLSHILYNYLSENLNMCEVLSLDNWKSDIIYICFSNEIYDKNMNFIYVNDDDVDINLFNENINLKYFVEPDIKKYNVMCENFDIKHKIIYLTENSIKSLLVTCKILDLNNYDIDVNNDKLYVVNLPGSIKRKNCFIENNKNINYELISAIKYSPGFIGCAISHKSIIMNAMSKNLNHIKICEDDCIILNEKIINKSLEHLINNNIPFELLSCFIVNLTENVKIYDKIILDENYCLLKINEWTSTVCNIYHKNAYKYFDTYDYKNANDNDKDKNGNLIWTIDRFLQFKDIWVIYPYPVEISNEISEIWKSKIYNGDNSNDYNIMKDNSLRILKEKLLNI
jgi:GR25 family glycosyltransferase involved in LPS biosynthesis